MKFKDKISLDYAEMIVEALKQARVERSNEENHTSIMDATLAINKEFMGQVKIRDIRIAGFKDTLKEIEDLLEGEMNFAKELAIKNLKKYGGAAFELYVKRYTKVVSNLKITEQAIDKTVQA